MDKPVLLVPHTSLSDSPFQSQPKSTEDRPRKDNDNNVSSYGSSNLTNAEKLIYYATQYPKYIQTFMTNPHLAFALDEAWLLKNLEDAKSGETSKDLAPTFGNEKIINLTGITPDRLLAFFKENAGKKYSVKIVFDPNTGHYRVEAEQETRNGQGNLFRQGAWEFTSVKENRHAGRLMFHYGDQVIDGARVLFIPSDAQVTEPETVALSRSKDGTILEFHTDKTPSGSSVALLVDETCRERLDTEDVLKILGKKALKAIKQEEIPAIALDLDGTIFNSRAFGRTIFMEWLQDYDGEDAEKIRIALSENTDLNSWNSSTMLEDLNFSEEKYPEAHNSAMAYFKANYPNATRRLEVPEIEGMVRLVKSLMNGIEIELEDGRTETVKFKLVYVTNRTNKTDILPNGGSSSITHLKRLGIWDDKTSVLLLQQNEGNHTKEGYAKGNNEAKKWETIKNFKKSEEGRNIGFVGAVDNDPDHTNGYIDNFGKSIVVFHVQGDQPPHKRTPKEGTLTVNPKQMHEDFIEADRREGLRMGYRFSSLIAGLQRAATSTQAIKHRTETLEALKYNSRKAAEMLQEINSQNEAADQSLKAGFFEAINERLSNGMVAEDLEDMINIINDLTKSNFATVRNSAFISDIIEIDPETTRTLNIVKLPASFQRQTPNGHRKIKVQDLGLFLPLINSTEDLRDRSNPNWFNEVVYGEATRMNFALGTIVSELSNDLEKNFSQLVALEYGPRLAIGALSSLAEMGLQVKWSEEYKQNAFHTEQVINALPTDLQENISRVDPNSTEPIDLVICNDPPPHITFDKIGQNVVDGGMMVVQTHRDFAPETTEGWEQLVSVSLNPGECVMPSAFLHIATSALTFQVWQRL